MGFLRQVNDPSAVSAFREAIGVPGARYRKLAMRCRASAEEAYAGEAKAALLEMALAYDRRAVELEAKAGLTADRPSDADADGRMTGFFPAECPLAS